MRPNILLISADQQRADCFGFKGRNVKTPHLDALAAAGTHFDACITPCVVCQPARASMLTGQLPRTHGVHDNGIDLDPKVGARGFAGMLAQDGYDTAYFGKAHFSTYHTFEATGTPECLKSSARYPDDWYGPYMGFDHVELVLVGHNWWAPETPPGGQHYERWFHADGQGADKVRMMWENAGDTRGAAQTWHSRLPEQWHNSTWIGDRTCAWLQQDHTEPFCTWVSFPDPHHPFDAPEPWSRLHDPAEVDLPEHRTRDFTGRPWWHEQVLTAEPEGAGADIRKSYSRIPPQTDDQLREIIANTYGQIALIDHNVGRILDALETAGLAENTIVIYVSDHGDWLGDHGLILKGPMHFDGLLKVPMIVRGPGVPAGARVDDPVSTLDLMPTFADLAGAEPLHPAHGASLRPLWEGRGNRDFAYNEWELLPTRTGVALSLRTVRTRTHKLTVDLQSGAGEMYDLVADPNERFNLWDDPAHGDVQAELMAMVHSRPDDAGPIRAQVGIA
ncbi:sulfatase-like hydrolase/transferase [uncultured Tateyamaria sp.]|uniref:sulfatase-like hydrolase/transferase n=1 Tax=uncultured Tateyamaria sp. TaxID=455651 RepID=UPI00262CB3E7|nr:sulfatase-like hydrolase/transferase [uncultured Tateyamaria sp.]